MKPLVVIPARGGSKGVPKKNIKLLDGKPLIHYTIEAARELFLDKFIYLSTDDIAIKTSAESIGLAVPFMRPDTLATDSAGTYEVLLHAIRFAEYQNYYPDTLILLQPTSPFRNSGHITDAISLFDNHVDMVVSVKETTSNPYFVLYEENQEGFLQKSKSGNFIRRQDCPKVWEYNGAIYIINIAALKSNQIHQFNRIKKYVMDEYSSHDIDTMLDWKIAELLIKKETWQ